MPELCFGCPEIFAHPTYTPSVSLSSLVSKARGSRLAVGQPSSLLPRLKPSTTLPTKRCGGESATVARSTTITISAARPPRSHCFDSLSDFSCARARRLRLAKVQQAQAPFTAYKNVREAPTTSALAFCPDPLWLGASVPSACLACRLRSVELMRQLIRRATSPLTDSSAAVSAFSTRAAHQHLCLSLYPAPQQRPRKCCAPFLAARRWRVAHPTAPRVR